MLPRAIIGKETRILRKNASKSFQKRLLAANKREFINENYSINEDR
jgi:hypothetical protein